ncbi:MULTISPECIES: TetR/AcrR family transcriptional regulator [Gordonia]|uniref:TetR/AcrR family transcriptional regulator n=2 Tax=Gordonia TaxID=2053 RepID=A0ABN3HEH2_9ACTN|nr:MULTISPECIES: TetR/AcrR family transcriptional regulator [Gordonia]AUH69696.1 TetR/AcrR family transcriptional regulator [Gordonia sp. YC-JH1]KJR09839.1 TetR family transcriptional regulator [Gordonia sihwensis]KXT55672.1 TetR family transcriptional regulator [Gordonia sp. QH-12]MBY4570322.1 TetR family transcriptional regulator [Gordonia sihwensis]WFN93732.1 TetR/AcrR family transcriptional regulator [Gordonia sihwensis]
MAKHSAVDPDEPTTKSEQTRKRLREGAMASFSELGFHGTGTRHIATAAGMSPAAVYVHYSSKEELLFEISLAGHEAILRIVRDAAAGTDDPVEQLRRFIREFAMYHADRHVSARVVNYELRALEPDHRAQIVDLRKQIEDVLAAILHRGIDQGVFDTPDPRMAAVAIVGSSVDVARWFRDGGTWSTTQVADFYADAALRIAGAKS